MVLARSRQEGVEQPLAGLGDEAALAGDAGLGEQGDGGLSQTIAATAA